MPSAAATRARSGAWEETLDPATGSYTYTPAGSPVSSDILRTVVRHRAHSVQVRTVFADLRNNDQGAIDGTRLRTNEGLHREVWLTRRAARRAARRRRVGCRS